MADMLCLKADERRGATGCMAEIWGGGGAQMLAAASATVADPTTAVAGPAAAVAAAISKSADVASESAVATLAKAGRTEMVGEERGDASGMTCAGAAEELVSAVLLVTAASARAIAAMDAPAVAADGASRSTSAVLPAGVLPSASMPAEVHIGCARNCDMNSYCL